MTDQTQESASQDRPFEKAYAEWLSARAAEAAALGDDKFEALSTAEDKLLTIEARSLHEIRLRALVVEYVFSKADWDGDRVCLRDRLHLQALISDVLRFDQGAS